jgi:hypothetical protein
VEGADDQSKAGNTPRSVFSTVSSVRVAYRVGASTLFAIGEEREVDQWKQILQPTSDPIEHRRGGKAFERQAVIGFAHDALVEEAPLHGALSGCGWMPLGCVNYRCWKRFLDSGENVRCET